MFLGLKKSLALHSLNYKGWKTKRRIIVIESDDWGSVRMPSREVYEKFLRAGIPVDKCPYNKYDSLASEEDLNVLFNLLNKFVDNKGNHPIITANSVVANPLFSKIRNSYFKNYFYEPFTETLKSYPKHSNSFDLWKKAIDAKLYFPQFHGREHVNVNWWLQLLQNNNRLIKLAFDNSFWGLGADIINNTDNIQASFDARNKEDFAKQKIILNDGLKLFNEIFKYRAKSFIANNYIWDDTLNYDLKFNNIAFIQGMKYQKLPYLNNTNHKLIRHYTGEFKNDLLYTVRNCAFEPSHYPDKDNVSSCLKEIQNAFYWDMPAIISSHRLNYIGFIDRRNREKNISQFENLIKRILKTWRNVEFLNSIELGDLILNEQK